MITQDELKSRYLYDAENGGLKRIGRESSKVGMIKNGYLRVNIDRRSYAAHRLAWLYVHGEYPECDIDHINHDRTDNRISNLRLVDRQGNMRNARLSKANSSGFTGVTWDKVSSKWTAQIMIDGKTKKLGRFDSMIDAVAERIRANRLYGFHKHHGSRYA